MELERVQSTPDSDPIELYIVVVGGELTSIDRYDGYNFDAITSILDMSAIATDEMSASMEDCRELVIPSPPIVSMTIVDSSES